MSSPAPTTHRIPTSRKFVFALGDHTINVAISALSLVFFFFLTTVAGLEPWRAGTLVWIARIVDAVTDPMMGRISDRTRSRFGRRRPWFLVGAIPFGISYALLWQSPFEGQTSMMLYYLTAYIGLSLSMTVLSVPYMALIPEWSRDFDERTSLNTVRAALAVIGTMVAATLPALAERLGDDAEAFAVLGIVVGVWLVLPWLAVFWASEEPSHGHLPAAPPPLRESLRTLLQHGTYLRLCGFYLCSRVTVDLLGLAFPLYMAVWLGRKGEISSVLLTMLVVVVISLPVWLRISLHSEKHKVFIGGAAWFAAMLVTIGLAPPSWPGWTTLLIAALLGVGYAICDLMPWAMVGEVIDEDELRTGERREGLYNGVFTFLRKAGGASAYGLAGFALSAAGYDAESGATLAAAQVIRALTSFIPALFLVGAVALALGYPLTRARHREILAQLEARSAEASTRAALTRSGMD
jgi:sugar (glycoside-pentoside-hexuronide) transporter